MAHENLSREQRIDGSTDRAFGFVFASVFVIVAGWPLVSGAGPRWWAAAVAGAFALVAVLRPSLLAVPNRWWMKLGLLLGAIVSPVALGVLFYGVFTPIGAIIRLTGRDPLRLARDAEASSYWSGREPPGPPPQSMERQF